MTDTATIRPGHGPQLLIDAPILQTLEAWRREAAVLRSRAPSSDALCTLEGNIVALAEAVDQGRAADAWVPSAEAARLRGCSASLIRKLASKGQLTAQKRGGTWVIHRDSILAPATVAA
jgi:hypothetical protein